MVLFGFFAHAIKVLLSGYEIKTESSIFQTTFKVRGSIPAGEFCKIMFYSLGFLIIIGKMNLLVLECI